MGEQVTECVGGCACGERVSTMVPNASIQHHGAQMQPENLLYKTVDRDSPLKIADFGNCVRLNIKSFPLVCEWMVTCVRGRCVRVSCVVCVCVCV